MATCKECIHSECCFMQYGKTEALKWQSELGCKNFKDRSRFMELLHAEWIVEEDMYGDPVYCCSNCREKYFLEEGTPIENRYFYCPNCGAKMDEQALKEMVDREMTPLEAIIVLDRLNTEERIDVDRDKLRAAVKVAKTALNRQIAVTEEPKEYETKKRF